MDAAERSHEIVIVGGGICGLATALALHRKGIKSVVLERSDNLRATGAAIGVFADGWRALDQLGVASSLRQTALPIQGAIDIWLDKGKQQRTPFVNGETRCLRRSDLINTLAEALPHGTLHFGCQIDSIKLVPETGYPILLLPDGSSIVAKVLIGCDGGRSVVADFLDLKPTKVFKISSVRGLTNYPNGHAFAHEFVRIRRGNILVGRIPITDKLVYWFFGRPLAAADEKLSQDPELIKKSALESLNGFPEEIREVIKDADPESVSFTHLRYRSPWDLLLERFRKGTVTVAGDAMHVMGPFLGQGGSAGLEDAVVLARSLAQKMNSLDPRSGIQISDPKVEDAINQYLKERRMRIVWLSTQTYLAGQLIQPSSLLVKIICSILMAILFSNAFGHTTYDCGTL